LPAGTAGAWVDFCFSTTEAQRYMMPGEYVGYFDGVQIIAIQDP